MHANNRTEITEVYAGDIAAAVGLKNTTTGDTLCDEKKPCILESMEFPEPVIDIAIEPKDKAAQEKMGIALAKLSEEEELEQVAIMLNMTPLHVQEMMMISKDVFSLDSKVGSDEADSNSLGEMLEDTTSVSPEERVIQNDMKNQIDNVLSTLTAKEAEILIKVESDTADKYISMVAQTITDCVMATNQTYVESLKKQGSFDAEAQKIADEQDLDLVMISPNAKPPVCKIMDYGKYRFEQNKKVIGFIGGTDKFIFDIKAVAFINALAGVFKNNVRKVFRVGKFKAAYRNNGKLRSKVSNVGGFGKASVADYLFRFVINAFACDISKVLSVGFK